MVAHAVIDMVSVHVQQQIRSAFMVLKVGAVFLSNEALQPLLQTPSRPLTQQWATEDQIHVDGQIHDLFQNSFEHSHDGNGLKPREVVGE